MDFDNLTHEDTREMYSRLTDLMQVEPVTEETERIRHLYVRALQVLLKDWWGVRITHKRIVRECITDYCAEYGWRGDIDDGFCELLEGIYNKRLDWHYIELAGDEFSAMDETIAEKARKDLVTGPVGLMFEAAVLVFAWAEDWKNDGRRLPSIAQAAL